MDNFKAEHFYQKTKYLQHLQSQVAILNNFRIDRAIHRWHILCPAMRYSDVKGMSWGQDLLPMISCNCYVRGDYTKLKWNYLVRIQVPYPSGLHEVWLMNSIVTVFVFFPLLFKSQENFPNINPCWRRFPNVWPDAQFRRPWPHTMHMSTNPYPWSTNKLITSSMPGLDRGIFVSKLMLRKLRSHQHLDIFWKWVQETLWRSQSCFR